MLSRPVASWSRPSPAPPSSASTRPWTSTLPLVGGSTPAMIASSVDLPAPLAPTSPSREPSGTSRSIPLSASIVTGGVAFRRMVSTRRRFRL